MKYNTAIFVAIAAVTSASTVSSSGDATQALLHDSCYTPDGPCTQLDAAISAAKGILANPFAGPHSDEHSKRAEDYLSQALNHAEKRDYNAMAKRSSLSQHHRWTNWCGWVGEGCGKVRRSATVIKDILDVEKRSPEPRWTNWCGWVGEGCGKARRSTDELLNVANEILSSLPEAKAV